MYHPHFSSKFEDHYDLAKDHHKELLEVAQRERLIREVPSIGRPRRTLWISLAVSTPIVLLILRLTVLS
jgi:hypothetical protein